MKLMIAITTAALFAAAAPASAQSSSGAPTAAVKYADLDLSTSAGREAFEHRIDRAVAKVCPAPLRIELSRQPEYRACQEQAWASARQQTASIYSSRQLAQVSIQLRSGK